MFPSTRATAISTDRLTRRRTSSSSHSSPLKDLLSAVMNVAVPKKRGHMPPKAGYGCPDALMRRAE